MKDPENFEEAIKELESITRWFDNGKDITLDEMVKKFERGALLKKYCETMLANAKATIEKIITDQNNISTTEATDV